MSQPLLTSKEYFPVYDESQILDSIVAHTHSMKLRLNAIEWSTLILCDHMASFGFGGLKSVYNAKDSVINALIKEKNDAIQLMFLEANGDSYSNLSKMIEESIFTVDSLYKEMIRQMKIFSIYNAIFSNVLLITILASMAFGVYGVVHYNNDWYSILIWGPLFSTQAIGIYRAIKNKNKMSFHKYIEKGMKISFYR